MRRKPNRELGNDKGEYSLTIAAGNTRFEAKTRSNKFAFSVEFKIHASPSFNAGMPLVTEDVSNNCVEMRHHCFDPRRIFFNFSRVVATNFKYSAKMPSLHRVQISL